MFELIKIDLNDERSLQLLLEHRKKQGNWKSRFIYSCILKNYEDPKLKYLDNLTDMEAIIYMVSIERKLGLPNNEFLLLKDGKPVANINIIYREPTCADITVVTLEEERQKGYAKKAVEFIEEYLYRKEDIIFTTIIDLSKTGASTHIAQALGYKFMNNTGYYIKMNPYMTIEEAKELAAKKKKAM